MELKSGTIEKSPLSVDKGGLEVGIKVGLTDKS